MLGFPIVIEDEQKQDGVLGNEYRVLQERGRWCSMVNLVGDKHDISGMKGHADRQADRRREKQTDRDRTETDRHRRTDGQTDRQTGRQTDRQAGRWADRQASRWAGRWAD